MINQSIISFLLNKKSLMMYLCIMLYTYRMPLQNCMYSILQY